MMKTAAALPVSKQEKEVADAIESGLSGVRTAETLLRVVPMGFCLAALILTIKNSVDNDFGSVSYSDLGSFKYLVYMNGLCAGYSIFSAFYTAIPRPLSMSRAWTIFFLDQVVTYAILAAGAAAAEIVYLAYEGDEQVTWSRVCGVFGGFCRKAKASVVITFGAVACYVLLSLISSYRLFSAYHAPVSTFAATVEDNEAN
ncbi:CASP-like protein 2A1 [Dendrobium catenatum]|uniref:CASP-like protein n=1 Tax=Dendrobium catenatum TaxID=906689 RepID=A0A2I0V7P9_9ASPA|nr:CASP-like protein 2A1 [Dendrobium catenatum]PKU59439.1 CASP-like protein [Dendrobium catenatum]